jgi:mRNA (2'-O-methyladenosine-N6-)-methyltransferase
MAGSRRFKSKLTANYDLCEACLEGHLQEGAAATEAGVKGAETLRDFYVIENATEEDILHEYHKCNMCGAEPIWGIRFKCGSCEDVDLCEPCFDIRLKKLNLKAEEGASADHVSQEGSLSTVGPILC